MKVVICADIHLDGSFQEARNNPERLALRRADSRQSFSRIIARVRETQAHLLLIAGDLFDANKVTEETIAFLKESFSQIPDTYVFISPGNNDPATHFSPYLKESWPENVYIFTGDLEAVELSIAETQEAVRIYGAGFRGQHTPSPLLKDDRIPELDPNYVNILLMHGAMEESSACNPLSEDLLNRCGFDFCALGHQHHGSGVVALSNTGYAYPGTPENRNFRDAGGILVGTISHKVQNLVAETVSTRQYVTANVDITQLHTHDEIADAFQTQFPDTQHLYRITLTGVPHPLLKLSLKSLRASLDAYFYLQLRTHLTASAEDARPLQTGLLEDYFLNEAAKVSSSGEIDAEVLRLSVQYGLATLRNQDALENVFSGEEFESDED